MRVAAIFAVAVLLACRPEPVPASAPAPAPEPTAELGTAVAIHELGERWEHRAVVEDDGRIALPLCGAATVAGATPAAVCDAVASCLSTVLREPFVEIAFDSARASCLGRGEPLPMEDALLEQVAARLARDSFEPHAIEELIDLAVARHVALLPRTEQHPEVRRQTERAQQLLAAAHLDRPTGVDVAGLHVSLRLTDALEEREALPTTLGPKHPDVQQAERRIAALRRVEDAVGLAAVPPSVAYVRAHERALVENAPPPELPPACPGSEEAFDLRIAYWRGRRDAARDPTEPERILDGLVRARIDTLARCGSTR